MMLDSEKQAGDTPGSSPPVSPTTIKRERLRPFFPYMPIAIFIFLIYLTRSYHFEVPEAPLLGSRPQNINRWEDVPSSPELDLRRCFDGDYCARLEVPLNWNSTDPEHSAKAKIAIIVKRAEVNFTDPRYGGVLLWNPGGPGGSATVSHYYFSQMLQGVVNTPGLKYYDVLSFDPRGVANTEPHIDGFKDPVMFQSWMSEIGAIGHEFSEAGTFTNVWTRIRLWAHMLAQTNANTTQENDHVGQFVNTVVVVRDMVEILEQYGMWREKVARAELGARDDADAAAALERTKHRPGEEKLNYWGFSYGTVLGQTFALMQPHRVQRMVLDGTVDLEDWNNGLWSKNINDIDKITEAFAAECVKAGPESCPIAEWATDGRPETLLKKALALIEEVKENPLTGYEPHTGSLSVITHSDLVSLTFSLWYVPNIGFRIAASILDQIDKGNAGLAFTKPPINCFMPGVFQDGSAAQPAIHCTDATSMLNTTTDDFRKYITELETQSPMFANVLATVRIPCTNYNVRPKWRYDGPYTGKTPVGILFADQSLDPITPLRNGERAATLFSNAGVLEVKGYGHCSIAMPNVCGILAIQKYFRDGETQKEKIVCPQEASPFDLPHPPGMLDDDEYSAEQQELRYLALSMSEMWATMRDSSLENRMYL